AVGALENARVPGAVVLAADIEGAGRLGVDGEDPDSEVGVDDTPGGPAVGALQDLAGGGARGSPCIERGRRLGVNGQGNGGTAGQDSAPALSPVRALEGAAREGSRIEGCGSQGIDPQRTNLIAPAARGELASSIGGPRVTPIGALQDASQAAGVERGRSLRISGQDADGGAVDAAPVAAAVDALQDSGARGRVERGRRPGIDGHGRHYSVVAPTPGRQPGAGRVPGAAPIRALEDAPITDGRVERGR